VFSVFRLIVRPADAVIQKQAPGRELPLEHNLLHKHSIDCPVTISRNNNRL
jgi:hypothetical protein